MKAAFFTGLCSLLVLALAVSASAGVRYVSTAGSDATGDGTAVKPYRTIQKGINSIAGGGEVVVGEGVYLENIDFRGKRITVRSIDAYDPAVVAATIIDGDQKGSVVTFTHGESDESVIDGFTIRNGLAEEGGGIFCRGSSPTIVRCVITDNMANAGGNYAGGGGICSRGGHPTISNCTISSNTGLMGGGIGCFSQAKAAIAGCEISGNMAYRGGGGICFLDASGAVSGCTVADNVTGDWDGGGILGQWGARVSVYECTITGNEANGGGGLAFNEASTPSRYPRALVMRCTITNNRARNPGDGGGGGISFQQAMVIMLNDFICGNIARNDGGGIFCRTAGAVMGQCTIDQNVCIEGGGGGVAAEGSTEIMLSGCIVTANSAPSGPQLAAHSMEEETFALQYTDVAGGEAACFDETGSSMEWFFGNLDADPLFAAPGHREDNGAPGPSLDDTWVHGDYHVQSVNGRWDPLALGGLGGWVKDAGDSPCLDGGDPSLPWSGEPEPNGCRVNMGAYGGTGYASKSPSYGSDDVTHLTVATSHPKGPDEAVWPYAVCPIFLWVVNNQDAATFLVDVSTDQTIPLDDRKHTIVLKTATGMPANVARPSKSQWKRIRRLATLGEGTLYWRVRAFDAGKSLIYTSEVKTLIVDGGEWDVSDIDIQFGPGEVSWTHVGDGVVKYRLQFSVEETFPASSKLTVTLPPRALKNPSYVLPYAAFSRIMTLALKNGVAELYYRVQGLDADNAFVTYSEAEIMVAYEIGD